MSEKPIIFSGEMVRAILDGRKTMTRRVVDCPPDTTSIYWTEDDETVPDGKYTGWVVECGAPLRLPRKCPYGQPGGRLWVRESFKADYLPRSVIEDSDLPPLARDRFRATIDYRASQGEPMTRDVHMEHWRLWLEDGWKKWKPSIHMPRWASRITLEITSVRVERVQDISVEDMIAEGMSTKLREHDAGIDLREQFSTLWNHINAKRGYGWDVNPLVWVIDFRRIDPQ